MLYGFAKIVVRVFLNIRLNIKASGIENVPEEGAFILAVNHKSNYDPVIAGAYCPRRLTFMAKEELFENPVFGDLIKRLGAFPVKRGRGDVGAIKDAFAVLKNGNVLLMFPQGHRMKSGVRGKAQTGVAMIAYKMKVPVVPMCISGDYGFRKKIRVTFGQPIEFSEYYDMRVDAQTLQSMADTVLDNILIYDTEYDTEEIEK